MADVELFGVGGGATECGETRGLEDGEERWTVFRFMFAHDLTIWRRRKKCQRRPLLAFPVVVT